ncbi:MAG: hypothetical protein AAB838_01340, partial [Patescibacteria group bacterium]
GVAKDKAQVVVPEVEVPVVKVLEVLEVVEMVAKVQVDKTPEDKVVQVVNARHWSQIWHVKTRWLL